MLGGQINMAVGGSGLVPHVVDGSMRALMIWTREREIIKRTTAHEKLALERIGLAK